MRDSTTTVFINLLAKKTCHLLEPLSLASLPALMPAQSRASRRNKQTIRTLPPAPDLNTYPRFQ